MNKLPNYLIITSIAAAFITGAAGGLAADRIYINSNFHEFVRQHFVRGLDRPEHGMPHDMMPPPPGDPRDTERRNTEHQKRTQAMRAQFLKEITVALALTKEQNTAVAAVLDKHRIGLDAARETFLRTSGSIFKATDDEIRAVLSPDQKKKFDAFKAAPKKGPMHTPRHMPPPPNTTK